MKAIRDADLPASSRFAFGPWAVALAAGLWGIPHIYYIARFIAPDYCWDALSGPRHYVWLLVQLGLVVGLVLHGASGLRSSKPVGAASCAATLALATLLVVCAVVDDQWRVRAIGWGAYRRMAMHQQDDPLSDAFYHWRSVWLTVQVAFVLVALHHLLQHIPAIRPKLREAYGKLILMLAPFLLALVALEVSVRAGWLQEPWATYRGGEVIYRLNCLVGWSHRENMRSELLSPEYRVKVRINSVGLRDDEYAYERRPDGCRLLCLGDSFTFGVGVDVEDRFSEVLERRWLSGVDVINAGVTGYGTDQEYLYLKHEGARYRPDLVILAFYSQNDMVDNTRAGGLGYAKPYFEPVPEGLRLVTFLNPDERQYHRNPEPFSFRRHSRACSYIARQIYNIGEARKLGQTIARTAAPRPTPADSTQDEGTPQDAPDWLDAERFSAPVDGEEVTRALVAATRSECSRIGAELLVVLIAPKEIVVEPPDGSHGDLWLHSARSHRAARDICRDLDLTFIDTLGELARRVRRGEALYYGRDPHWTAQGHAAIADLIVSKIEAEQLLPADCLRGAAGDRVPADGSPAD